MDRDKMPSVKPRSIQSLDIVSAAGGLDERGDYDAAPNTFVYGRNVMPNRRGLLTQRFVKKRWLPDTIGKIYQIYGVTYNGNLYHFTADAGKIRYIQEGETAWTDCGGSNVFASGPDVKTTFVRVLDKVIVINGVERISYVDLTTMNIVKFNPLTDPVEIPTIAPSGITVGGSYKIYYAISFNSTVGETKISPIYGGANNISKDRYTWKTDGTEYIDVNRNNTAPSGAVSWNLYMTTKAAGGTVQASDMLPLAVGIDIATTTFRDNGSLPIDLSRGTAPEDNSTDGPVVKYGIETGGRPILYGDVNAPYNIWIGGDGEHALDFSPNNGGYRTEVSKGTNYYPTNVVGFRNGQGIPSLTVLFSNPNGLSRQAILEQQTVTFGEISFVVWGITEQNYGSAGVAAPYGVANYLGGLYFPSTDGFVRMDTEASLQNVLSSKRISDPVYKTVESIKNTVLENIVCAAWDNRIMWSIPSRGYDNNNEILIHDISTRENPIWYKWEISCQWIGVISPSDDRSFVYICEDNHIYKLMEGFVGADDSPTGASQPFAMSARGGFVGLNQAHNSYKAVVQVVFDLVDFIGDLDTTVSYLNRGKKPRSKTKPVEGNSYAASSFDGWDNPHYTYAQDFGQYLGWSDIAPLDGDSSEGKVRLRSKMRMKIITNEMQWQIDSDATQATAFILRAISYEGVDLGNKVDLR
jgi:hypothetical protein